MATAVLPVRRDSYESYQDSEEEQDGPRIRSTVTALKQPEKRKRSPSPDTREDTSKDGASEWVEKKRKKDDDSILTKTGGAYIPPARLRMMQAQITDKTSVPYQRMAWEALKKSINGLINKVNISNIADIVRELFQENIVRGRGLLARSVISAQSASPTFTHVYAALVSIINTKFPQIGELIAKRLIISFQKAFKRNDKKICLSSVRFIAHLVNQQVVHELLSLELLTVLLEDPTSDSVEVAVGFLKECGQKLTDLSPRGVIGVFESLKAILHDASVDIRVQYMIEVLFAIRKDKFSDYPSIAEGLDLINEDDQITHLISLDDDELDGEDNINVFKVDNEYQENEDRYKAIKEEILGEGSSDEEEGESDEEEESEEEEGEGEGGEMKIIDETQTDMLELRRTIYLTIMSSLDFEECAHKLLKMEFKPGQESEVANMIIECCSQERSYQRFYGLLGERFCHLEEKWVENFDSAFQEQYATVHRLETNKLRNTSKFFAQLFYTDALPWTCLSCIHLNEEETNSSSRIFIKILFQELAEYMGLQKLNERLKDQTLSAFFEGLMPRDNPKNTRFSINFFTSIGLGGLTDDLREHLKNAPKNIMDQEQEIDTSSDSDSDSDSSSDDDSSSDSSDSSESSEEEVTTSKKKRSKGRGGGGGNKKKIETEKMRRKKETRKDSSSPSPPPASRNKRRSPSPERRRRRESAERRRGSPAERRRGSPERRKRSPDKRKRSPAERRRGSPAEKRKGSPAERRKGSPAERRKRSPAERRKGSPAEKRKGSPAEKRKGSPAERRKRSPDKRRGSPPDRRVSPDSRKRRSPNRRREVSSSPEDRKRRGSPDELKKDRRDRSPPQRKRHDSPEEEDRTRRRRHSPERRRDRSTERKRRDSPHDRRDRRNRSPYHN